MFHPASRLDFSSKTWFEVGAVVAVFSVRLGMLRWAKACRNRQKRTDAPHDTATLASGDAAAF